MVSTTPAAAQPSKTAGHRAAATSGRPSRRKRRREKRENRVKEKEAREIFVEMKENGSYNPFIPLFEPTRFLLRTEPAQTQFHRPISRAPLSCFFLFIFCTPHNTDAPPFSAFIHFAYFFHAFFLITFYFAASYIV